jgi:CubicO group peptidase (beta-lactamase class C family)
VPHQVDIKGHCADQFTPLKDAFRQNFEEGHELGASLCLTLEGETIVDIWGGFSNLERTRPWEEDTIACVFSCTKIPTIICALILIDRGLLALDEPVATYWPEFAQNGKDKISVRQAFTHRARVPSLKDPQPMLIQSDWNRTVELIAAETPWFNEDTLCYHPHTFGFILGELVSRVSGKSFLDFYNEELVLPMGADFQIGLTDRMDLARVAILLDKGGIPHEEGSLQNEIFRCFYPPHDLENPFSNWEIQSLVNPAATGHGNARSLTKFATMLANDGTFEGHSYLSSGIVDQAGSEQYRGIDPMLGDLRLGLGFGLDGSEFTAPTPEAFHWGGYGGSWCFMDPSRRLAGAYVMNNCLLPEEWGEFSDPRMDRFVETIRSIFC